MCEPATIAYAAAAVIGAASAYQQGRERRAAGEYNTRVSENEATRLRNISIDEENKQRRATAELISRQRAQLAAANIDIGSGSALQLQEDTALLGEIDALNIRENFAAQASSLDTEAALTQGQGRAAGRAGTTKAFSSLLGGAARVSGKWYNQNSQATATV